MSRMRGMDARDDGDNDKINERRRDDKTTRTRATCAVAIGVFESTVLLSGGRPGHGILTTATGNKQGGSRVVFVFSCTVITVLYSAYSVLHTISSMLYPLFLLCMRACTNRELRKQHVEPLVPYS